jgi:hypothetical protein
VEAQKVDVLAVGVKERSRRLEVRSTSHEDRPLMDMKPRLRASLDESGAEAPVVITRNGKPLPCCWFPRMTLICSVSCSGVRRVFKPCSIVPGKASRKGKAYPRRHSGKPSANERANERPQQQALKRTGVAILVSRDPRVAPASAAGWLSR